MGEAATTVSAGATGTTSIPGQSTGGPSGVQNGIGQTGGAGPVAVPAGATPDWTSNLAPALKEYVTGKGFKDLGSVVDSYRNLETKLGVPQDRLVKLPEKLDAPEMGEVFDRLGRPKDPTGYAFPKPSKGEADATFSDFAQKLFHSVGLSKAQGETIASKWNEFAEGLATKDQTTRAEALKVDQTALKKEWGATWDQNLKACQKGAARFGFGQNEVNKLESALGYSATMKFLSKLGSSIGEADFVVGQEGGGFEGAMTPDAAKAEIEELKKDKSWVAKYASGDRDAFKQMSKLMELAFPDVEII